MLIEDYKRINGWLNVRVNLTGNQSLYDFSEYFNGEYHSLSEAHKLYNEYKNNRPERLNPEVINISDAFFTPPWNINEHPEKTEGWVAFQEAMRKDPEYYRCDSPNTGNK